MLSWLFACAKATITITMAQRMAATTATGISLVVRTRALFC
jgi:hypothetical protein